MEIGWSIFGDVDFCTDSAYCEIPIFSVCSAQGTEI